MDIANLQIKADSTQVSTATKSLKGLESQSRKTEGGIDKLGRTAKKGSADFGILEKSIFSVKNLIGTVLVGSLISFSDEMTNVSARIQNSTRSAEEFQKAFSGLSQIASETGGSISASVDVFQRLSFVRNEINASIDSMVQFTGTVQKFGVVSGASTGALNAGLLQLGQALSSDVTRAEEFNSIMENIPAVGVAIAEEFGVTTGQLRQLVLEGQVLSKDVFQAILNQTEKANEQFDKMPLTIGRATAQLINQFKVMVAGINDSTGASQGFAIFISKITEAVKALNFIIIGTIKGVEVLITGALNGIFRLVNFGIEGLNRYARATADVYNYLSKGIKDFSGGFVDLGERQARQFQSPIPETQFIDQASIEMIQGNFVELAKLNNDLFSVQEKQSVQTKELSQDYTQLAANLKEAGNKTEEVEKKTEKTNVKFKESKSDLQQYAEEARNVTDQLQDMGVRGIRSLEDNLVGLIRGTVSVADAFRSMADQIIDDLIRIQIRKSITEPLSGALDSFLPSIGSALFGGVGVTAESFAATQAANAGSGLFGPGFATGGSFTVGGSGGPDSQLVPLRLTPGEIVNVRKGGQDNGGGQPIINITNNVSNANVQAGKSPDGRSIEVIIDETVAKNIQNPGTNTNRAIRNFGSSGLVRG